MDYSLRQFLKDLFDAFEERRIEEGAEHIEFRLVENLRMPGEFHLSSSVCPFTLVTITNSVADEGVADVAAYVRYDLGGTELAEAQLTDSEPIETLHFSAVKINDDLTWHWLYCFFTTMHPIKAARNLERFVAQHRNGVNHG